MKIIIKNEIETKILAEKISLFLFPNICLLLYGPLASGKTIFTKYLLRAMGITDIVTSPTFLIMQQYILNKKIIINHMDCYRLLKFEKKEELEIYFESFVNCINIIEWPSIIVNYLLNLNYDIIKIIIKIISEQERIFIIKTTNKNLLNILKKEKIEGKC